MSYLDLNKRLEIVKSALKFGISESSRIYLISRPTVTKWVKRFKEGGYDALKNKERRPSNHPNKMPLELEENILNLKKQKPDASASFIKRELNLDYDLKVIIKKLRKAGLYDKEKFDNYSLSNQEKPLLQNIIISFETIIINRFDIKVILLHDKYQKFMIPFLIHRLSFSNILYAIFYLTKQDKENTKYNFFFDKTTETYIPRLKKHFIENKDFTFSTFDNNVIISLNFFSENKSLYSYFCTTNFDNQYNVLLLLSSLYNSNIIRNNKNDMLKNIILDFLQPINISDSVYKQLIHTRELQQTYTLNKKYLSEVVEKQIKEAYRYFKSCFINYNYVEADKIYTILNLLLKQHSKFVLTHIDTLRKYGQLKLQQGMIFSAEKNFSNAEKLSIISKNNTELIKSYKAISHFYLQSGKYQKAFTSSAKLLNLLAKSNGKREYFEAKLLLAEIVFKSNKYVKSASIYNDILINSKDNFPLIYINSLFGLSAVEFLLGNFSIAWKNLKKAEELSLAENNENLILDNFFKFGEIYIRNDYFRYRYIKTLAEKSENYTTKLELMNSLSKLGDIFFELEEFKNSLHYYQRSLIVAKENNHTFNYCRCLAKTGNVLIYQQKYTQAFKLLQEGHYISIKNNFIREQIFYLTRLSKLMIIKKKNLQAKQYSNQALKLAELHNFPELLSDALIMTMYTNYYSKEYNEVISLMNKSKDFCVKYRNIRNLIITHLIGALAAIEKQQISYAVKLLDIGINLSSNIKINYYKSELLFNKLKILYTTYSNKEQLETLYNKTKKSAEISERNDILKELNSFKISNTENENS